jgi:hypothetical protein
MKITMQPTEKLTEIDGVPVRLWMGKTESGIECHVFVHRIAVHKTVACGEFERELLEQAGPGIAISLRHIL